MNDSKISSANNVTTERVLAALREARLQLEQAKAAQWEPIAVVGMSCRFPGSGETVDSFWDDLCHGRDAIREITPDRWDLDQYYDPDPDRVGRMYIRKAALLDRVDIFDAAFFGISPREAASMDPQQRLLLEVAWEALENAAIAPDSLANTRTGVFLGIGQNDYSRLATAPGRENDLSAYDGTGNGFCFAAGRISYVLGLQGPNLAVDTACSSSLVAVHLAMDSLRRRESDCALAAGVQLILSPEATLFLSRAKALSPDGCSRPFSADANGYGRGEGCGVLVLKRLSDARQAGDRILAVLRGSAVNHDGPSSGLTVPNVKAQESLLHDALANAGIQACDVGYLEAHGTGTILGDPLEMRAVGAVFGGGRDEPLRIGSVKANIGHLEAAAGMAGLVKTILILQHGQIPAALHAAVLNPRIPWDELPVEVPRTCTPWTTARRIAGVSSFSLSGTNAHLILEAYESQPAPFKGQASHLLVLSAKSPSALLTLQRRLLDFLEAKPDTCLAGLCYTLGTGRAHHAIRWAAVVNTLADASTQLRESRPQDLLRDEVLEDLAHRYVAGGNVPWDKLYTDLPRTKLALPTYPFERQRHWLAASSPSSVAPSGNPLLARRTQSPLIEEILFEGELSVAATPFLADHRIFGEIVVPGAFHVAAMLGAAQALLSTVAVELRDVVFPSTLMLPEGQAITLQAVLKQQEDGSHHFTLLSLSTNGWNIHAQGYLARAGQDTITAVPTPADPAVRDVVQMYASLERRGIGLGPAFRWIADAQSNHTVAACRMAMPSGITSAHGYPLHPGLVDSCFQLLGAAVAEDHDKERDDTWIPFHIGRVRLTGKASHAALRAVAQVRSSASDIYLLAGDGQPLLEISGLEVRKHSGRSEPLYELEWRKLSRIATPPEPGSTWLVVADAQGTGDAFARWLREQGCSTTVLRGQDILGQDIPEHAAAIAHFGSLDQTDTSGACDGILQLLRTVHNSPQRLLVFTRGAQRTNPAQSLVWGLHPVLRAEYSSWNPAIIDLDIDAEHPEWAQILAHTAAEDRLAFKEDACWAQRLVPYKSPGGSLDIKSGRTYLITGGLGALGLRTAQWLHEQGASHLVLAGRRAHNSEVIDQLRAQGADVRVVACDVSQPTDVAALLGGIYPPLAGIVHAAGMLEDGLLAQQTPEGFARVLAPKVSGAWNLHQQTLTQPLDFFVCYSSIAALLASSGQGAYAAANAFLDSLMRARRAQGLPGLSIGWGPWAEAGMAADSSSYSNKVRRGRWESSGVGFLMPEDALRLLGKLLASDAAYVAAFDFHRLAKHLPVAELPPILSELTNASEPATVRKPHRAAFRNVRRTDLLQLLSQTGLSERTALLADYMREQAGNILGHGAPIPENGESLTGLGVDSLMAIEMRTIIGNELGRDIPVVRFLDGSGIAELAAALAEQFSRPEEPQPKYAVAGASTWVEGEL